MKLLSRKITEILPDWNNRIFSLSDGEDFCEANSIILVETDLITDLGVYRVRRGRPFIILHKFIETRFRAWVLWHEIGHFILHTTSSASFSDSVMKRKTEKEAHIVAALALMPTELIKTKTLFELQEEMNFPRRLILFRKEIFEAYKI